MSRLTHMRDPREVAQSTRLRVLRERQGLSRETLRQRLAADPEDPVVYATVSSIHGIEKGHQNFPWHHADAFARALDVPLSVLMGWTPGDPATVPLTPYVVLLPGQPAHSLPYEPGPAEVAEEARQLLWEAQTPEQKGAWKRLARTRLRERNAAPSTQSDQSR